jgi:hypothetical protein
MSAKHPASSRSLEHPSTAHSGGGQTPGERDRKKMELGDAMEHEHGQDREDTAKDIQELDKARQANPPRRR